MSPEDCASIANPGDVLVAAWVMKFKDTKMTPEQARMKAIFRERFFSDKGTLKRIGLNFSFGFESEL